MAAYGRALRLLVFTCDSIEWTGANEEHGRSARIVDAAGHLQYIPFPVCAETKAPLHLSFGHEGEINCTIPFITDEFFHLLEFYIHNDAPLSCRIPSKPLPPSVYETAYRVSDESTQEGVLGSQSTMYTPLVIALAGTLQLSHLHVGNYLNLLVHASPKSFAHTEYQDYDWG
ncbi:hypothetical protein CFE70_005155 [Pyrenophora teres f. teres 0-1]